MRGTEKMMAVTALARFVLRAAASFAQVQTGACRGDGNACVPQLFRDNLGGNALAVVHPLHEKGKKRARSGTRLNCKMRSFSKPLRTLHLDIRIRFFGLRPSGLRHVDRSGATRAQGLQERKFMIAAQEI